MRSIRWLVCVGVLSLKVWAACDFAYDPASVPKYYREQGWALPGVADYNPHAKASFENAPISGTIPGAVAQLLPHDDSPYIAEFPTQEFLEGTVHKKLRTAKMHATIVRWVIDARTVAYSYGMSPVEAHKKDGKWVIDAEAGCTFFATFVDDRGDGVFRLMVPSTFTRDLIPAWIKKPEA
jgi:hypothetical protein